MVLSISSPWSGRVMAKFQLGSSCWITSAAGFSASASAGQMRTQSSQPVQSHGETWMRYWKLSNTPPPIAARLPSLKLAGALPRSWFVIKNGRTAACGQMRLHLLHCVHLSMSTTGTLASQLHATSFTLCAAMWEALVTVTVAKVSHFSQATLIAIPRFSYWLVPHGTRPPGTKALTGSELPSRLLQGVCTCLANWSASCTSGNMRGPLA